MARFCCDERGPAGCVALQDSLGQGEEEFTELSRQQRRPIRQEAKMRFKISGEETARPLFVLRELRVHTFRVPCVQGILSLPRYASQTYHTMTKQAQVRKRNQFLQGKTLSLCVAGSHDSILADAVPGAGPIPFRTVEWIEDRVGKRPIPTSGLYVAQLPTIWLAIARVSLSHAWHYSRKASHHRFREGSVERESGGKGGILPVPQA